MIVMAIRDLTFMQHLLAEMLMLALLGVVAIAVWLAIR
jgi:hypothetical protein